MRMPTNSELYTSLVIRARAMATMGGTSDQNVAYTAGCAASPPSAKAAMGSITAISSKAARAMSRLELQCFMIFPPACVACAQKNSREQRPDGARLFSWL